MFKSTLSRRGIRKYIGPKRLILFLMFIVAIGFLWKYYEAGLFTPDIIVKYSYDNPVLTVLLFEIIYIFGVIAALPCLPLNLAAGFLWGGVLGGFYTTLAVTIGGWISFAAARGLVGSILVGQTQHKWISTVQEEFKKNGWKFVAFMRINPIIPTGPLNYLLGLTSLSNLAFISTTFIFLLPPSIAVSYIGYTLHTFTAEQLDAKEFLGGMLIISASFTALAIIKLALNLFKNKLEK
jgi:uncharacterized membrane protein YdjX (TVP38/TMEM64 family)